MAKSKKKVEVVEAEVAPVEVVAPKSETSASSLLTNAKELLAGMDKSHREINLAAQDAIVALNRALSLVLFIENTMVEISKKKR